MKKPLILLVDDDSAVLEALEAELTPALSEICRIEVFSGGAEVLEALDEWTREERSIAVAIVDQKMPGMTGVELLTELRRRAREGGGEGAGPHPAAFLRAILLTGYAGLDSAVEAKNSGEVERYLEKPWGEDAIRETVPSQLTRFLESAGMQGHFLFCEAREHDELADVLRLRYEVYRQTEGIVHVLPPADESMDVDEYDAISRLFGLVLRDSGTRRVVGCMRIVGGDEAPALEALRSIVSSVPGLDDRFNRPRARAFPLMTYLVDAPAVARLVEELLAKGETVAEPGRFALDSRYRSGAGGQGHLARHMIEGTMVVFFHRKIENAILTCIPPHTVLYRRYGFRETRGTRTCHQPALDVELACLHGRANEVPEIVARRLRAMQGRLERTGSLCRCATYPDCLTKPYATGDFAETDLFCPAAATETLSRGESA